MTMSFSIILNISSKLYMFIGELTSDKTSKVNLYIVFYCWGSRANTSTVKYFNSCYTVLYLILYQNSIRRNYYQSAIKWKYYNVV